MNDLSAPEAVLTEKPPERAAVSWWVCIRTGVITYYLTSLVVLLGVLLGLDFFERAGPPLPPREIPISADPFLLATTHWDGRHYLEIVREGYSYDLQRRSNVAFFPLYPVLVAGVHRAAGLGVEWAGLLVAHVLLLAAFVLLAAYVQRRYFRDSPQSAAWAVLAFGLFPTTFFLRMSYSESTFLLLAVLAMFGIQRRWRPIVVAGIVGLATATRPVGVALLAPLWLYVWGRSESREAVSEPSGPHPQPLSRWRERGVLKRLGRITCLTPLALWGLLGYMVFQYAEFGEPLAFAKTQSHWQQRPAEVWGEKALALAAWEPIWSAYMPSTPGYAGRPAAAVPAWFSLPLANPVFFVVAAALVGLGAAKRWLSGPEILLAAGLLLIPYATRGFDMCMASQGRFAAVVFPMYLVMGRLLCAAPPAVSVGVFALSAVYLAIYAALFAAGHVMI